MVQTSQTYDLVKIQIVSDHFRGSDLPFSPNCLSKKAEVADPAPTGGSRKFCDRMNAFAQKEGLPGMGYIFWRDNNGEVEPEPLAKNIGPERTRPFVGSWV